MYRNHGVSDRGQASYRGQAPYVRTPESVLGRVYRRERPVHWGVYEVLSSALFIVLSLMFVVGIAAMVLHIIGFDSLTQVYGFDQMIGLEM